VVLAVFLGISSIFLGFSLFGALFGIEALSSAPALFFARSFGILSLLIPAHFGYAAFILADPKWRPDRIFFLSGILIPFLTLAAGFSIIRDFEARAAQFAFLNFTGKTGFSMLIIFITVIEVILLQVFKNAIFNKTRNTIINNRQSLLPPPESANTVCTNSVCANPSANSVSQTKLANPVDTDNKNPGALASNDEPVSTSIVSESDFIGQTDFDKLDELGEEEIEVIEDELLESESNLIEEDDSLDDDNLFNDDDDKEDDDKDNDDAIFRALEEAEAAAAAHADEVRKKKGNGTRYKKYNVPIDILNEYPDGEYWVIDQATRDAAMALKETLEEFKIQAEVTGIRKGPVITMFEILPAPGVKLSKIVGLQDNIALRLAASSVRIVAPIPGKHAVGIEVPNAKRNIVSFKEIIEDELRSDKKMELPVVMGKDITGEAQTVDLVQMPHLLIAGATGSGKSVCVNAIILSLLYQLHPADCRLMMIDPKIVELKLYNDIPHLLTPVITESKKAFQALQYLIYEMERRYACLDKMGVRDIRSYNKRIKERGIAQEHLPYIVVIIDEFADLMSTTGKELEATVARLAAKSRAIGIHLVLATQRPSIDVITGLIKANIPSRIAFMVASKTDSRIIIDMIGADKLLGKGDMLYSGVIDPFPIRMQGAFISEEEVEAVVEHVKTFGKPDYIDDEIFFDEEDDDNNMSLFSEDGDPLYDKALEIVMQQGKASASYIQRKLSIGFNRAARIVDEMEHNGVVGPANGSKPRELLHAVR